MSQQCAIFSDRHPHSCFNRVSH